MATQLSLFSSAGSAFTGLRQDQCFHPDWVQRQNSGYAIVYERQWGRAEKAHRIVFQLLLAPIANQGMVLHRCGNGRCYNPYHLYWGDAQQNRRDMLLHKKAHAMHTSRPASANALQAEVLDVLTSTPAALSTEACQLDTRFKGFAPQPCFISPWVELAEDGHALLRPFATAECTVRADRYIFHLFNGATDLCDVVEHTCNRPECLNPYHLIVSGRIEERKIREEFDKRTKLTLEHYVLIAHSSLTNEQLASEVGVHSMTVSNIRREHGWSWIGTGKSRRRAPGRTPACPYTVYQQLTTRTVAHRPRGTNLGHKNR